MATHSSILAWRIPWTEEPGGLQSMGLQTLHTTERLTLHFVSYILNCLTFCTMLSPLWSCALTIPSQLFNILALSLSYHLSLGGLVESEVYGPGTVLIWGAEIYRGVPALPC